MGRVHVLPTVDLGTTLAPAGARILEVLKEFAVCQFDVTVTSGRDGPHSGPDDPHHSGEAFDIRSHDLTAAAVGLLLGHLIRGLGARFYVVHEAPGTPNAHIHAQRRKGTTYSSLDYLQNA